MSQEAAAVAPAPVVDLVGVPALVKYIRALCPVLLDAREEDIDASFSSDQKAHEALFRFISDAQEPVIYIQKIPSADAEDPSGTYNTIQPQETSHTSWRSQIALPSPISRTVSVLYLLNW